MCVIDTQIHIKQIVCRYEVAFSVQTNVVGEDIFGGIDNLCGARMEPGAGMVSASVTETNPVLLNQNADELFAQKRYAEAIPLYRRAIELDPEGLDAYNDLGLALHYGGQTQAGLEILRVGTDKDPGFQRIWLTLGFVSAQSGDAAGAGEALQKALDLDPDNGIGQEAKRLMGLLEGH